MEWAEEDSGQIEQHDDKQHAGYTLESVGATSRSVLPEHEASASKGRENTAENDTGPQMGKRLNSLPSTRSQ